MPAAKTPAIFFQSGAEFRQWLERNHTKEIELFVGFYKKASGLQGIAYLEAVEEALCFGWIDGVLSKIDDQRYCLRFTPRKPGSIWSLVNVERVQRLTKAGHMHPAGIAAYEKRTAAKTGVYSFERTAEAVLPAPFEKRFRANRKAWAFFTAQAPWYRRLILHKIVSAKQDATKERWLSRVIAASAAGVRLNT